MRGAGNGPRPARLFYALWPSTARRRLLAAACLPALAGLEGSFVPPGNLHVTLAFLGAVPGRGFAELLALGEAGGDAAVDLSFSRVEYWPRPRVLVALPEEAPAAAVAIVERLWRGLEPLGYEREQRPWQAHLTIARRLRQPPAAAISLAPQPPSGPDSGWSLALVESLSHSSGPRYRPMATWPLA